jgi:tellurite resistance protein
MSNYCGSKLSETQRSVWLRCLLDVALADNAYSSKEQTLIQELFDRPVSELQPVTAEAIAMAFADNPPLARDFLRTAVMVALVDGDYSDTEHKLIQEFCTALNQELDIMSNIQNHQQLKSPHNNDSNLLDPLKAWLDGLDIKDSKIARFLCKAIPAQCPFERDIFLFGRKIVHIPAMCQINPLYDQLVYLRFRSLTFLADECGEDISEFC